MALAIRRSTARPTHEIALGAEEFDAFYRDALPRIYGYFLRRCGNDAALAEELTQETFVAAVRRLAQGDRIEEPLAWLFAIARRKLVDHIRAASARRRIAVEWDEELVESSPTSQAEPETAPWTQDAVEALLPHLPDAQRIAIVLRYLDDLSVPEVAQQIGRSIHATESLLARGRANLKRLLVNETEHRHG